MIRLFAIARNAFVETVRQPIYGVVIGLTFLVLVMDVPLSSWTMGGGSAEYKKTDQQMLVNLGLSTLLVSGLLMSAFSAAAVLSREIEDRTVLTVVVKPVPRAVLVLGKYLGVAGALIVAYYLCSLALLMTVRHGVMPTARDKFDMPVIVLGNAALAAALLSALLGNYFFGWSFASSAVASGTVLLSIAMGVVAVVGKGWRIVPFGQDISGDLLMALLVGLFCVLVFAAVAVAASTRLGWFLTLWVCFGFFVVGSISQFVFRRWSGKSLAAALAYRVWPNFSFFYTVDALTQEQPIPLHYAGLTAAYALCLIVAILAVGVALFQRRELESTPSGAPLGVSILAGLGRAGGMIAGFVGLVWLTEFQSLQGVATGAGLLAAGGGLWVFAGWFGRGVKWTYYATLVAALLHANVIVLAVLLLPVTRHHFGFVPRRPNLRSAAAR